MSQANSSIIYVGSRRAGRVYAVANKKVFTLKTGLRMPNGAICSESAEISVPAFCASLDSLNLMLLDGRC